MFIGLLLFAVDQAIKQLFGVWWPDRLFINHNLAFGLGSPALIPVGLLFLLGFGLYQQFQPRTAWWVLGFMIASNLVDRIWTGGVLDYIAIGSLHLNLADIFICYMVTLIAWNIKKDA